MSIKRRAICSDFLNSSHRSVKKRRTEEVVNNNNSGRSSNRRKRDEISRDDINDDRSSNKKTRREEEDINMISNSLISLKFYEEDDDATPVVSFPCYVDEGILTEILSRLPAKSLLRFKSVSEYWLNLITRDQHFIHQHSTRSESRLNLLCIAPVVHEQKQNKILTQRIFTANISVKTTGGDQGKFILHNVKQTTDDYNWFNYDQVLEPVNGLVCFIHRTRAAVRVYNVSTREVSPWIESTLFAEKRRKFWSENNPFNTECNFKQIYQIGFDPEKKEHKVFCFWSLSAIGDYRDSASRYANWEALTVGRDTKWRKMNMAPNENNLVKIKEAAVPPYCSGVHANGTIYWLMSSKGDLGDPNIVIAFDVGSEKFRIIPIPSFILDDNRKKMFNLSIAILDGRLTLIYQMSSYVVKLWMLDDEGVEKKLENCQGKGTSNWSEETITLPSHTEHFKFHGFAPNADRILFSTYEEYNSRHSKINGLYSYDREKDFGRDRDDGHNFLVSSPSPGYVSIYNLF